MDYYLPNRKKKRYKTKFVSNINVTPLVDVMLVLLIIFMITAPIINNGADIQLPKTNLNNINNPHEVINLTVGSSGNIKINDTSSSYQNMISDLNSFNKNKQMQININGDYRADYGTIAKIIVKLNTAGFSNIALITEPE